MTLRARRWYYSIAILTFFLGAPLVIATAAGWRWNGWRQGFVETSSLVITATPRATVTVNGSAAGPTPQRLSGLTPGTYHVRVSRPGFTPWEHVVLIKKNTSQTIGPIQLFRIPAVTLTVSPKKFAGFVVSPDQTTVAGWSRSAKNFSLHLLWPTLHAKVITIPQPPDWIVVSPREQRIAVGTSEATLVYSLVTANETTPWILPSGGPVNWLTSSETIFYRLESEQLVAYDQLATTRQELQPAQSLAAQDDALWISQFVDQQTRIEQRGNILDAPGATVATLPGQWHLVGSITRGFFLATADGSSGSFFSVNRVTGRVDQLPLEGVTTVWPGQDSSLPLWLNGVDVVALSARRVPIVLSRSPLSITRAGWIDPGGILAILDESNLTIRSISSQQGRGTLATYPVPPGGTPLLLDQDRQSALIATEGILQRLSWR